jgi:hypothetical protein
MKTGVPPRQCLLCVCTRLSRRKSFSLLRVPTLSGLHPRSQQLRRLRLEFLRNLTILVTPDDAPGLSCTPVRTAALAATAAAVGRGGSCCRWRTVSYTWTRWSALCARQKWLRSATPTVPSRMTRTSREVRPCQPTTAAIARHTFSWNRGFVLRWSLSFLHPAQSTAGCHFIQVGEVSLPALECQDAWKRVSSGHWRLAPFSPQGHADDGCGSARVETLDVPILLWQ